MRKFELISMEQARNFALQNGYIIVDLRSEEEFYRGHIENAVNLPDCNVDMIDSFGKKNYTWILYCRRGSLSFKLASDMAGRGYDVMAVVGGYRDKQ